MSIASFNRLLMRKGSDAVFHKDSASIPCPCRTPQGTRSPEWHRQHPQFPVCNKAGFLPASNDEVVHQTVKAFIQPMMGSGRMLSLNAGQAEQLFGNVKADDHIGIFPVKWNTQFLDFDNWGRSGEDYISYNGSNVRRRFTVVAATLVPDPITGDPQHHWEVALRIQGES